MIQLLWVVGFASLALITFIMKMFAAKTSKPKEPSYNENYDADDEVDGIPANGHASHASLPRQLSFRKRWGSSFAKRPASKRDISLVERRRPASFHFSLAIAIAFAVALVALPLINCMGYDTNCQEFCGTPMFLDICFSTQNIHHDCCLYCPESRDAYLAHFAQIGNVNETLQFLVPEFNQDLGIDWEARFYNTLMDSGPNFSDPDRTFYKFYDHALNNLGPHPSNNMEEDEEEDEVPDAIALLLPGGMDSDNETYENSGKAIEALSAFTKAPLPPMPTDLVLYDPLKEGVYDPPTDHANCSFITLPEEDITKYIDEQVIKSVLVFILAFLASILGILSGFILRAMIL